MWVLPFWCCILSPKITLKLISEVLLSYLEAIWSFWGLFFWKFFLRGGIVTVISLRLIVSCYQGNIFLSTLPSVLWILNIFYSGWWKTNNSQSCVSFNNHSFQFFHIILSPDSYIFLIHMCSSVFSWSLWRYLGVYLFATLPSNVFCLGNYSYLGLLDSQFCLFNSRRLAGSACIPLPCLVNWNSFQIVGWDSCRAHLFCFPSFRNYCSLLCNI